MAGLSHKHFFKRAIHATIDELATGFELVINFGTNRASAQTAIDALRQHPSVTLRGVAIPVTSPDVSHMKAATAISK